MKHRNWHVIIETCNNVTFMVKFLVAKKVLGKILGRNLGDNSKSINTDLFRKKMVVLIKNILLQNNIC